MIGLPPSPIRAAAAPAWAALQHALDDVHYQVPCAAAPDIWAAENDPAQIEYAERHCTACPVLVECNAYATAAKETGAVWGGRYRPKRAPGRTLAPPPVSLPIPPIRKGQK